MICGAAPADVEGHAVWKLVLVAAGSEITGKAKQR